MQTFSNTFHEAKLWLDRGIATIPIIAHSKKPALPWKRYQAELPSIVDLIKWFREDKFNLALICGWQSLTVLDFDTIPAYCKFVYDYPQFKNTYSVKSARGKHLYFYCDNPPKQSGLGEGIDVKSTGYCLTYPSVHPSGIAYEAENDREIMKVETLPVEDSPSIGGVHTVSIENNYGTINVNTPNTRGNNVPAWEIKARYPITLLFPNYHFSGDAKAMAHCPGKVHSRGDVNPSLSLDLETNRANCLRSDCEWHSARGFSNIDCYMIMNHLSFYDALAAMATELGI